MSDKGDRDDCYERGYEKGWQDALASVDKEERKATDELSRLRSLVQGFEDASGVKLENFRHTERTIGRAVRMVLDHGDEIEKARRRLACERDRLVRHVERIDLLLNQQEEV